MRRQGPHYRVAFRRRREARTDYRRRLRLLRAEVPRAVVRKTNTGVIVQVIDYADGGDRILATATGRDLRKLGWSGPSGNVPAAYLTGLLAGRRAKGKGVSKAVLDIGRQSPSKGGRVFAVLRGLIDGGLEIPHDEGVLPSAERLLGKHLPEEVAKALGALKAKVEAT